MHVMVMQFVMRLFWHSKGQTPVRPEGLLAFRGSCPRARLGRFAGRPSQPLVEPRPCLRSSSSSASALQIYSVDSWSRLIVFLLNSVIHSRDGDTRTHACIYSSSKLNYSIK